jgi:hypothetical protein
MVSERVMVTNWHVAMEFAVPRGGGCVFLLNFLGEIINPRIDICEELGSADMREMAVAEVRFIVPAR